jgi:gas vesicle protein
MWLDTTYALDIVIAGVLVGFVIGFCVVFIFAGKVIDELERDLMESNEQVEILVEAIKQHGKEENDINLHRL